MKILLVHNRYRERGGEDDVFEAEARLLTSRGHTVIAYERHNDEINSLSTRGKLHLTVGTTWAVDAHRDIQRLVRQERPDVAHFHNTFPLISPAAYHACNAAGVPVVQTVHNYRLVCPAATLMRDGRVCEECVGRVPWPGVVHACYRDSRAQSLASAVSLSAHRAAGTYQRRVQRYLALTEFMRDVLVKGGFPESRIDVKPNFVAPTPTYREARGHYALFVGRLAQEKGVRCLLDAWRKVQGLPLRVVGDGPLRAEVEERARSLPTVTVLGRLGRAEVLQQLQDACVLVFPSEWYEGLGNVILEAFAVGVPVVASAHGAPLEVLEHGRLGTLFRPGDPDDLAAAVARVVSSDDEQRAIARAARGVFEARYSDGASYEALMRAYRAAAEQLIRDRSH